MANPPSEAAESRFNRTIEQQSAERKTRGWDMRTAERRNREFVRSDGSTVEIFASVPPSISGTAQVGQTLTANSGTWSPSGTSQARQWLANGSPISGATGTTYTVQAGDLGKTITVRVTSSKADYTDRVVTSNPTAAVIAA